MKKISLIAALICLTVLWGGITNAVTLNLAPVQNAEIKFTGVNDQFNFTDGMNGFDFIISTANNSGDINTVGLKGNIAGPFTIGTITPHEVSSSFPNGIYQTAPISGNGSLGIIDEDSKTLSANIRWIDILTIFSSGQANTQLKANLSNVTYTDGVNADLQKFLSGGITTLSFQFTSPKNLSDLTANNQTNSTSYSISMTPIPLPGALLLLGAGLVRLGAYGRQKAQERHLRGEV